MTARKKPAGMKSVVGWEIGDKLVIKKPDFGVNKFMFSSHYHCKKCGSELQFVARIPWSVWSGVQAIGFCKTCPLIFIEREYKWNRWIKI